MQIYFAYSSSRNKIKIEAYCSTLPYEDKLPWSGSDYHFQLLIMLNLKDFLICF
jgi:hypothetical protein